MKHPVTADPLVPTTALGSWYATVLFWDRQIALFVNESTLLPVLMPMAPATTAVARFQAELARVLRAHKVDEAFIRHEVGEMAGYQVAKTSNRSVVGIMTEFARLSDHHPVEAEDDILKLALWLAQTPCSPLYSTHTSPDRALTALVVDHGGVA